MNLYKPTRGVPGALECVCCFERDCFGCALNLRAYSSGEFPESYYAQCVAYLAVTGWERWYLAALVLNKAFYIYQLTTIEDDSTPEWCDGSVYVSSGEVETLKQCAAEFWESYIIPDTPPPADGREPTSAAIQSIYDRDDGGSIELFGRDELLKDYFFLSTERQNIQQRMDGIKQMLQQDMGEASQAVCATATVTWRAQERRTFDGKSFQKAYPEIPLDPFYKRTTSRVFKINPRREDGQGGNMNTIYKPKGAAAEYGDYALNIYTGCPHRCYYCFAPQVLHRDREVFHTCVEPRKNIVEELRRKLEREQITGKLVHLCFTCDPYPTGYDTTATREVIKALKEYGNHVQILTKGDGSRDFDLLDGEDWYGITLDGAPTDDLIRARLNSLAKASGTGIKTWVSFEPVTNEKRFFQELHFVAKLADKVKVGKLNYHPSDINWAKFGREAEALCKELGLDYYIKDSLRAEMNKEP